MNNIDRILKEEPKTILKLILEEMQGYQLANMRFKIAPHWADGKYGTWSHSDPLFNTVFHKPERINIPTRDSLSGDRSIDSVLHVKCKLCDETIINDKDYHDGRYSHLFADCVVTSRLRHEASSESEFRMAVAKELESREGSPHYYDCSIGRTGKCDCAYGS